MDRNQGENWILSFQSAVDTRRGGRCLPCAGSFPVLLLLGNDDHPDVPADSHLGARKQGLCIDQVFPFHAGDQSADASLDTGTSLWRLPGDWPAHVRLRRSARYHTGSGFGVLAHAWFLRRFCHQASGCALSYLATRCPYSGADGGKRHPGRYSVKDRRLWTDALRGAFVPGCGAFLCTCCHGARGGKYHLRGSSGVWADGHQTADRVHQYQSHGLHSARHFCLERTGTAGSGNDHAGPRDQLGGAVHDCRSVAGTASYPGHAPHGRTLG